MSKRNSKPSLYFAYGSNMRRDQMARRCPGAQLAGHALVRRYRFAINIRGYATILPHPTARVHGVLWHLMPRHEQALDRYESVDRNHYRKAWIAVELPDATRVQALVYIATDPTPGPPRPRYLTGILKAARAHGLPVPYIEELAQWELPEPRQRSRIKKNRSAPRAKVR